MAASLAAVVLVAAAIAWWVTGGLSARSPLLNDLMPNFAEDAVVSPVEVTDQVCPQERCVSAWETQLGTYLEFGTPGRAEYLHQVLGADSRINGNLVLDLTAVDLETPQMERAVQLLFADQDWP
ncbi:MAG: hypothetical protein Q4G34_00075 [Micrococcus sp.]|nr:hypothetical protein [Micrococcus sp.]